MLLEATLSEGLIKYFSRILRALRSLPDDLSVHLPDVLPIIGLSLEIPLHGGSTTGIPPGFSSGAFPVVGISSP